MKTYNKIVEENESEGEKWIFYFQADDDLYDALVDITALSPDHVLYEKEYTEDQVDFIVLELTDISGGYMSMAQKSTISDSMRTRLLKLGEEILNSDDEDEDEFGDKENEVIELLYKGGIFD